MFNFNLGKISFSPSYIQAGVIVVLLFILVLSLAQLRRHLVNWSIKGAFFGIFFGFILAIVLEGFLIVNGKTVIIKLLGWREAPKPIANLLDLGRAKLVQVLGIKDEKPLDAIQLFQSLNPQEASKIKKILCQP